MDTSSPQALARSFILERPTRRLMSSMSKPLPRSSTMMRMASSISRMVTFASSVSAYFLTIRLNSNKEITIYRIIQEALTNVQKYAETEEANVTIREMDDAIRIMVEDRGKGFDMEEIKRGVGLFS